PGHQPDAWGDATQRALRHEGDERPLAALLVIEKPNPELVVLEKMTRWPGRDKLLGLSYPTSLDSAARMMAPRAPEGQRYPPAPRCLAELGRASTIGGVGHEC